MNTILFPKESNGEPLWKSPENAMHPVSWDPADILAAKNLVTITPTPLKGGVGVIAFTEIYKGTVVLDEKPLLLLTTAYFAVIKAFEEMTEEEIVRFSKLTHAPLGQEGERDHAAFSSIIPESVSPAKREELKTWYRILNTNAWYVRGEYESPEIAVFDRGSRFNHSCIPNVQSHWNSATGKMKFVAIKHIAPGEELTVSYTNDLWRTTKARRDELQVSWGFICNCPACEGNDYEQRRIAMTSAWGSFELPINCDTDEDWDGLETFGTELAGLFEEEGEILDDAFYTSLCRDLAIVSKRKDKAAAALSWCRKGFEVDLLIYGPMDPQARQWEVSVRQLEAAIGAKGQVAQLKIAFLDLDMYDAPWEEFCPPTSDD